MENLGKIGNMIKEYAALIPKFLKNPGDVIEGFANEVLNEFGALPEDEQNEILRRRLICEGCPFNSKNAKEEGWYHSDRPDDHCVHCLCNIKAKTSCLNCRCGIEFHNAHHVNNQLELKWEDYKKIKNEEQGTNTNEDENPA